jgi:CDP-diacylglycerol--serine O-phosphatidyltransferase
VSSPIGKELDSLADDITFGLAPATIVFSQLGVVEYPAFLEPFRNYLPYVAFIIAAFSALRLAKFNLDERQSMGFIGLPTPANALFWGSLIVSEPTLISGSKWAALILIVLVFITSYLLVCELPMFALKFKHWGWKGNEVKYIFVGLSAIILATMGILEGWWMVITLYLLISLGLYLKNKK